MRKRFSRRVGGFRRKSRVSWWTPRTSQTEPGDQISCWADTGTALSMTGPNATYWPILWEGKQGMSPSGAGDDRNLNAHPWPQGFSLRAIRGEILVEAAPPNINLNAAVGWRVDLAIVKHGFLGDVPVLPLDMQANDVALDDWLWRRTIFLAADTFLSKAVCIGPCDPWTVTLNKSAGCTDSCDYTGTIDPHTVAAGSIMTSSQFFNLTTAMVVPVRSKTRRRLRPEQAITLMARATEASGEAGSVIITPKLRAVVSRPA